MKPLPLSILSALVLALGCLGLRQLHGRRHPSSTPITIMVVPADLKWADVPSLPRLVRKLP